MLRQLSNVRRNGSCMSKGLKSTILHCVALVLVASYLIRPLAAAGDTVAYVEKDRDDEYVLWWEFQLFHHHSLNT